MLSVASDLPSVVRFLRGPWRRTRVSGATVLLVLLSATLAGTSCRDDGAGCKNNTDCPIENRCRASSCTPGCDGDTDCKPGSRCEFNACVPAGPPVDAGTQGDASAQPDAGSRADAGAPPDAGTRQDAGEPQAGIGDPCQSSDQCPHDAMCVGVPYVCRVTCQVGGTNCNAATESCVPVQMPDGGLSARGVCIPGGAAGAPCNPGWCAELTICVAGLDGVYMCRDRCDPGAADAGADAGCPPSAPRCIHINNAPGGACLP
jgi:hypothetical protein